VAQKLQNGKLLNLIFGKSFQKRKSECICDYKREIALMYELLILALLFCIFDKNYSQYIKPV